MAALFGNLGCVHERHTFPIGLERLCVGLKKIEECAHLRAMLGPFRADKAILRLGPEADLVGRNETPLTQITFGQRNPTRRTVAS